VLAVAVEIAELLHQVSTSPSQLSPPVLRKLDQRCRLSTKTLHPEPQPGANPSTHPRFLQDLSSLDAGYDEEGGGTDDSSSTSGAADGKPWLELRCVLAVIRHGDRTPKQKMKVTVTQVGLELLVLLLQQLSSQ
jgi:hypothetical protein